MENAYTLCYEDLTLCIFFIFTIILCPNSAWKA